MGLPRIVGISGKIGSGKSTFARHLCEKYQEYTRMGVGDAVKLACSRLFDFPLELCYSDSGKMTVVVVSLKGFFHKGMTVREVLQWWGTDIVRSMVDKDHWVREIVRLSGNTMVVVDDIRFPNEAEMVKDAGGVLIRINDYPSKPEPDFRIASHPSETALDSYDGFDLVIYPAYGQLKEIADTICLESLVGKGPGTKYIRWGV